MNKFWLCFLLLALILTACARPSTPDVTKSPSVEEAEIPTLAATQAPTLAPTSVADTPTPDTLPTPISGGGYPPPAQAARRDLAKQLNLQVTDIMLTTMVAMDWSDSCLGAGGANEMCAQVITPGFEITLTAGAAQYVYHTDREGNSLRQVGRPAPVVSGEATRIVLKWQDADCNVFMVSTQAVFRGQCAGDTPAVPRQEALVAQVLAWAQEFAPFVAETPAGQVEFNGFGQTVATSAEQRRVAEWAALRYAEVEAGRGGAAWGLAWSYARSGGFAGFCETVGVYRDGQVVAENCKGFRAGFFLTASQLEALYGWLDGLQRFEYSYSDPAVTDAMTIALTFEGQGGKTAEEATTRQIVEFTAGLMDQAAFQARAGADVPQAEQTLKDFFAALQGGDFAGAAKLYGGDISQLQAWNPDIQDDLPQWLERACTQNGLQCLLPRSVTYRGPDARDGYQFYVEFNSADGTLFRQGPCCGDTGGTPVSAFLFAVVKAGDSWQVMDLPPYVP